MDMWPTILILIVTVGGLGFIAISLDYCIKPQRRRAKRLVECLRVSKSTISEVTRDVEQIETNLKVAAEAHVNALVNEHLADQPVTGLKDHMQRAPIKYLAEAGVNSLLDLRRQSAYGLSTIKGIGHTTGDQVLKALKKIIAEIYNGKLDFWPAHPFTQPSALNLVKATHTYLVNRDKMLSAAINLKELLTSQDVSIPDVEFASKPWGWTKVLKKKSRIRLRASIKALENAMPEMISHCQVAEQEIASFMATKDLHPSRSILDLHFTTFQSHYLDLFATILPNNQSSS